MRASVQGIYDLDVTVAAFSRPIKARAPVVSLHQVFDGKVVKGACDAANS